MKKITFIILTSLVVFILAGCNCQFNGVRSGALPTGAVGSYYNNTIELDNTCNPDFTDFHFVSGALPPGLGISSLGKISGTPTLAGTYNFTVEIKVCFSTDSNGQYDDCSTSTYSFDIVIA